MDRGRPAIDASWQAILAEVSALVGPAWSSRRIALASMAWTWGIYVALIAVRLTIIQFPRELLLLQRHVLTGCTGAGLTWCMYLLLRHIARASMIRRVAAAMLLALPAALLLTLFNYGALYSIAPDMIWSAHLQGTVSLHGTIARTLPQMYFVFAGWAALYASVSSAAESQEARRLMAVSQAESRDAQLRALRYQLDPHFVFNALNSVSALVLKGDKDGAERTLQALSLFLRETLDGGPLQDGSLAEEVRLQRLYLAIEQVRFGDRLQVRWEVPEGVLPARLPPLLLQPVVENVIRHGVAPTQAPVTMTVTAHRAQDRLRLVVEDDGAGTSGLTEAGVGLGNTASRLRARYGPDARCEAGPRPGGGFRVSIELPFETGLATP